MPDGYRRRLEFAFGKSLEIVAFDRVESVITPSKRLADYYAGKGKRVFRLDPTWDVPEFPDLSHFDSGPLKVGFLGTRSHWADLNLLRGALEDPRRTWEFHHFLGKRGPDWPVNLSNIVAHAPMPWSSYRSAVKRIRFHVCVYPMLPTSFNLARSCNKLMEHAMVGAGSLYSSQVPFADHLVASDAGLLVADGDWTDTLRELALDRYHCRELALRGHRLGLETSIRARASQQELWATLARI